MVDRQDCNGMSLNGVSLKQSVLTRRCCRKSRRTSMSSSVLSAGSFSRHSRTVSRTMSDWNTRHQCQRHQTHCGISVNVCVNIGVNIIVKNGVNISVNVSVNIGVIITANKCHNLWQYYDCQQCQHLSPSLSTSESTSINVNINVNVSFITSVTTSVKIIVKISVNIGINISCQY